MNIDWAFGFLEQPIPAGAIDQLIVEQLADRPIGFDVASTSMCPTIDPGDAIVVRRIDLALPRVGDLVVTNAGAIRRIHRVIACQTRDGQVFVVTKGDNCDDPDEPVPLSCLLGKVVALKRNGRRASLETQRAKNANAIVALVSRAQAEAQALPRALAFRIFRRGMRLALFTSASLARLLLTLLLLFTFLQAERASAAVTISSFSAQLKAGQVELFWTTATEVSNVGFNVLRSSSANGSYTQINPSLILTQCLGCVTGANYTYFDADGAAGSYFYKLQSIDSHGGKSLFGPASLPGAPPPMSTANPSPTRTNVPTATKTAVRQNTDVPTVVATATWTRTAVAPTTPPPQATANSVHLPTPQIKIAVAVPIASPILPNASGGLVAPAAPSAPERQAAPAAPANPIDDQEAAIQNIPGVEVPDSTPGMNLHPLMTAAIYGLSGLFGCGSILFALLSAFLLLRSSVRR